MGVSHEREECMNINVVIFLSENIVIETSSDIDSMIQKDLYIVLHGQDLCSSFCQGTMQRLVLFKAYLHFFASSVLSTAVVEETNKIFAIKKPVVRYIFLLHILVALLDAQRYSILEDTRNLSLGK